MRLLEKTVKLIEACNPVALFARKALAILARAARGCTATDAVAGMPLLRSQLGSEARGSERGKRCGSYGTLGCGGPQRVRRQNAYATLCANFR